PQWVSRINIKTDLVNMAKVTVEWFLKKTTSPGKPVNKEKSFSKKRIVLALCVLFAVFVFPIFLLIASPLSLLQAKRFVEEGKIDTAKRFLEISATTSLLAEGQFILYSKIPLVGNIYTQGVNMARTLNNISSIGTEGTSLLKESSMLAINALEGNDYDVSDYSNKLALRLSSIYEGLAFLESEMNAVDGFWKKSMLKILQDNGLKNVGEIKSLVLSGKLFLDNLPSVLGTDGKKTYLVLLQNNMELRPTGGFIGSFALVTLDMGKVSDITIQDVYSADGQMKGYVKPPDPIRDYLNEESWFLRDSNWDPDFPTSASRAEWFLDKEIDVSVDGVISVDLEPVKNLLGIYGPLLLNDYNVTLDENNFYEKTQTEAEKEFFPGSYRKSGFLTAVARGLTDKLVNPNDENSLNIMKIFYKNLNRKHIQIFLHDKKAQSAISDMGWDGSVEHPNCTGNCYSDWFGLVEANLGVNKSNYYIERSHLLDVSLLENMVVKKSLVTKYRNSANSELGPGAVYRTYTRLMVSPEAEIESVYLVNGESKESLRFDTVLVSGRKEIGFFMEIPPGGERFLHVDWSNETGLNKDDKGQYGMLWRKQPGVGDDPIQISFDFKPLTFDGQDGYNAKRYTEYNTLLSRDFVSRIFW
ncbi:MAG: DUF4012 domain-containing protein, partial [bacterium]|nr:DUF4012 domain-containing protein [bacterium]